MENFVWGAATSAYQIEGGRYEDGKGTSIWDVFSDEGRLTNPGDVTCDHYHRWQEDVDLLADLGVTGYRFSTAWTRIIPDGDGEVNDKGLNFYSRLVDGLLERGITPYLTLYHWDLPAALQERGGWTNRATAEAFARYARVVAEALDGRVSQWMTQNEPWVSTFLGHQEGVFAPGIQDWSQALAAGHHILLSHGLALEEIKSVNPDASVGLALDCRPASPKTDRPEDIAATKVFDGFRNRWFFDPVFGLGYPEDMMRRYSDLRRMDPQPGWLLEGDLDRISKPIDFLGINYYTTIEISDGGEESEDNGITPGVDVPPGHTEMGWKIEPAGLDRFVRRVMDNYSPASILITENGASYSTAPDEKGQVHDEARIDYISRHVDVLRNLRSEGIPVDGYFVWSFLDNLEWVQGYSQRFGLVWVDHQTGQRIPKKSFYWYRDLINASRSDEIRPVDADSVPGMLEPSDRLSAWMDGYVHAWTTNQPEDIAGIFTEDAVYDPQTADGEWDGLDEIVAHWVDIGDDPDSWEFQWLPLVEVDDLAIVVGRTTYLNPATTYRNLFVIRFSSDGRCDDFTEWYIEEDQG